MNAVIRPLYAAAAQAARLAAALAPNGGSKLARTFAARRGILGRYEQWGRTGRIAERPLLWVHAPSVGEGLQARPLLERMRTRHREMQLAYTYFSPSAERFASGLDVDFRDYLPFDTAGDARAALVALTPRALVFSKLDVWPVLVREASRRGVKLGLVSATLARDSSRGRGLSAAVLRDAYAALDAVGAVDQEDADRLVRLGVRANVVEVTGDTRFDQVWARAQQADRAGALLAPLHTGVPTLVAGSTWPTDEAHLLPAFQALMTRHPDARMIIAPHEPTAAHLASIERWAREAGVRLARLGTPDAEHASVVLVDRVGVLGDLYALADVAYVGGAFHAAGLHSVLEPAAFGAPVLFGPRHTGTRDARLLLDAEGAISVSGRQDLLTALQRWFADDTARKAAGDGACALVQRELGAADRSTRLVERLFGN